MKKCGIFALLAVCICTSLSFAESSIKAEVDRKILTTDDSLTYKIVIISSEKKLPNPQVPNFEGFNIISQAQSSTISFIKSEIKSILVYAFILAPEAPGKLRISPSSIKVQDKTYTSEEFEIEVTQGKILPEHEPQEKSLPSQGPPVSDEPQITL